MTPDLFNQPTDHLYRKDAPVTSIQAAESLDQSKWLGKVLECIKSFGEKGCIADDVLRSFADAPYSSITARFKQLQTLNKITYTGETRPGRSGKSQRVMKIIQ